MGRQDTRNVFRVQTLETGEEMYRIRLPSGEQAVFRTVEELTLAVQSGVVGPTAEVYLPDANRWMRMDSHPDFQAARVQPAAEDPVPISPVTQPVTQPPVTLAPIPLAEAVPAPAPVPAASPTPPATTSAADTEQPKPAATEQEMPPGPPPLPTSVFMTRARKLREMLAMRMGMILVIGATILVAIYVASHGRHLLATVSPKAHEGMTPPAISTPAPARAPAPVVSVEVVTADSAAAELERAGIPKRDAPRREQETLGAAPTLDSYESGYAEARDELESALDYIRFDHIFAPVRLRSAEAVRITRRSIAAAGNIVSTYRAREVMLEQTVGATRPPSLSQRESYEAGAAVRDMLDDSDSLYALLTSQQGRYTLQEGSITFINATAATIWNRVRGRLLGTVQLWGDSTGTSGAVTVPYMVHALTSPPPPLAR
jgi:hypothetical protein